MGLWVVRVQPRPRVCCAQELSGTTAVVILYEFVDAGKAIAWVANAGDSRAVLQTKKKEIKDLSEDQKPDTPAEEKRILSKGGYVSPPEVEWGGEEQGMILERQSHTNRIAITPQSIAITPQSITITPQSRRNRAAIALQSRAPQDRHACGSTPT